MMTGQAWSAMGTTLFVWGASFAFFWGLGNFILGAFRSRSGIPEDPLRAFWTGWASALLLLQAWHFFFPVDGRALWWMLPLGVAGILRDRKNSWAPLKKITLPKIIFGLALLFLGTLLANRALLPPLNYDSALYHLASVRWDASYPLVPGLGNLHGRLAYNSSYFLYAALLEVWGGKASHFANGLLMAALFAQILLSFVRLMKKSDGKNFYHIYTSLFFLAAVPQAFGINLSSPSPDLPVFILAFLSSAQLLRMMEKKRTGEEGTGEDLFYLTVLAVAGMMTKLSSAVFSVSALVLGLAVYLGAERGTPGVRRAGTLAKAAVFAGLALLPWMLRGIVLSGYPLYPSGLFPVNADWRMPLQILTEERHWIMSWARAPRVPWQEVLGNWDWLAPWAARMLKTPAVMAPLCLAAAGGCLIVLQRAFKKNPRETEARPQLFIFPAVLGLLFWFLTAPDPRFAEGYFWILGTGVLSLGAAGLPAGRKLAACFFFFCAIYLYGFLVEGKEAFVNTLITSRNGSEASSRLNFWKVVRGDPGQGFYGTPRPALELYRTRSGLVLYTPAKITKSDRCWDAPLPCTPYPDPGLRLRKKDSLRDGFTLKPQGP